MNITAETYRQEFERLFQQREVLRQQATQVCQALAQLTSKDERSPLAKENRATQTCSAEENTGISAVQVGESPQNALWAAAVSSQTSSPPRFPQCSSLLIAEIKLKSPTVHMQGTLSLGERVKAYNQHAGAISVVTHPHFNGSLELLQKVSQQSSLPLLAKDFVKEESEISKFRDAGASALLLLADWLGTERTQALASACLKHGLLPVVESSVEDPAGLISGPHLPLLNARDLFSLNVASRYRQAVALESPQSVLASDVATAWDARLALQQNAGVLVGEALMHLSHQTDVEKFFTFALRRDPLLKVCGAQSANEVVMALETGADGVGVNLIPSSRRWVSTAVLQEILALPREKLQHLFVLTNAHTPQESVELLQGLDAARQRLITEQNYALPILGSPRPRAEWERLRRLQPLPNPLPSNFSQAYGQRLWVLDGPQPGSGESAAVPQCPPAFATRPTLIAGGVSAESVHLRWQETQQAGWNVVGVDTATGVANESGVGFSETRLRALRQATLEIPQRGEKKHD